MESLFEHEQSALDGAQPASMPTEPASAPSLSGELAPGVSEESAIELDEEEFEEELIIEDFTIDGICGVY